MKIQKKSKASTDIPTASMPDIVFMLLLFFMVATVIRQNVGLPIDLPIAKRIEKLEAKKNVVSIWANSIDEISIDDKIIKVNNIATVMYAKRVANPKLIVSLKFDRALNMGVVTEIQEKLREADALKINYCAIYGS